MSRTALLRQHLRLLRGGASVGSVCFEAGPLALPTLPGPPAIPDGTTPDPEEWPMLLAALGRWKSRGVFSRVNFDKLEDELKARAVTAKRLLEENAIGKLKDSIGAAVQEGLTIKAWRREHWDELADRYGSAGASAPWYMVTVFRTNVQAAYSAGRYAALFDPEGLERAPLVLYDAIDDERVRPEHHALDGKVFRKDDPDARRYFPPLGYNCRCQLVELTEEEAGGLGLTVTPGHSIPGLQIPGTDGKKTIGPPPEGWDADRVDSLVDPSSWGWTPNEPKALAPAPPEPPAPLEAPPAAPALEEPAAAPAAPPKKKGKAKKEPPPGYAPNGLHADDLAKVWPTAKAQLLEDGKVYFPKSGKTITAAKARLYVEKAYQASPSLKPDSCILGTPLDPKWKAPKAPPKPPKFAPNGLTTHDVKAVFAPGSKLKKNGSVFLPGIPDAGVAPKLLSPDEARKMVEDHFAMYPATKPKKSILGTALDPKKLLVGSTPGLPGAPSPAKTLGGLSQADADDLFAKTPGGLTGKILENGDLEVLLPANPVHALPAKTQLFKGPDADAFLKALETGIAEKAATEAAIKAAAAAAADAKGETLKKLAAAGMTEADLDAFLKPGGAGPHLMNLPEADGWEILPNGNVGMKQLGGGILEVTPAEVLEIAGNAETAGLWSPASGALKAAAPAVKPKTLFDLPRLEDAPGFADSPDPTSFSPTWAYQGGESASSRMSFGAVVFDEKGRLLLREPAGHYDGYHWTFPKGTRDAVSDGVLATARREVLEETGCAFDAVDVLPGSFKGGSSRVRLFVGRRISEGAGFDSETSSVRWVDFTEARRLVSESTNAVGRQRDLEILAAAEKHYEKLTGVKPPKPPKTIKAPPPPPPPLQTARPGRAPAKPRAPLVDALTDFPSDPVKDVRLVRALGGSTGAELVEDAKGNRFVRKRGASPEHLQEECTADALYRQLGVNVPAFRLYQTDAGAVKLSRFLEGAETLAEVRRKSPARYASAVQALREDFAADALLGNWDVVGLSGDNVLVDAAGVPWRIDNGGSLRFRAIGKRKDPGDWTGHPTELWSLRRTEWSKRSLGEPTSDVFGKMGAKDLLESLERTLANANDLTAGLPVDLARVLGDRLDGAGVVARALGDLLEDGFADGYADDFARHVVGLRASGVVDLLPTTLRPKASGLGKGRAEPFIVDAQGKMWGGLRDHGSPAAAALDRYFKANGGEWGLFESWAGAQAGSSGSDRALATKLLWSRFARPTGFDDLYWHGHSKADIEVSLRSYYGGSKEAAAKATFTMQHAFTYNLLLRSGLPTVNPATRTIRAIRQESSHLASRWGLNRDGSQVENPKRGLFESYSFLREAFSESGYVTTEQEIPLHWILGTFLQPRSASGGSGAFYGDGENELVASFFFGKVRRIAYGSFRWK